MKGLAVDDLRGTAMKELSESCFTTEEPTDVIKKSETDDTEGVVTDLAVDDTGDVVVKE